MRLYNDGARPTTLAEFIRAVRIGLKKSVEKDGDASAEAQQ